MHDRCGSYSANKVQIFWQLIVYQTGIEFKEENKDKIELRTSGLNNGRPSLSKVFRPRLGRPHGYHVKPSYARKLASTSSISRSTLSSHHYDLFPALQTHQTVCEQSLNETREQQAVSRRLSARECGQYGQHASVQLAVADLIFPIRI